MNNNGFENKAKIIEIKNKIGKKQEMIDFYKTEIQRRKKRQKIEIEEHRKKK